MSTNPEIWRSAESTQSEVSKIKKSSPNRQKKIFLEFFKKYFIEFFKNTSSLFFIEMEKHISAEDMVGKTEEEIDMMRIMGFQGFDTTKGKKVNLLMIF